MSATARALQPGSSSKAQQLARRPLAAATPPAEQTAAGRSSVLLCRNSSSSVSESGLVLDNKNPSKLVVKPDGNILWEMPTDGQPGVPVLPALLRGAGELALVLSAASSGIMGVAVAVVELKRASENNYCVTSQHLAKVMAMTVSSSFAGTVAGLVYAPLLAARMVCGRFARPAALLGAGWAATRGVLRMLALRGSGPAVLLRELEEAALAVGSGCIASAEKVAARAAASGRFRRAFVQMGGVQALLRLLSNGLDGDAVRAVMQALAALLQEQEAQTVLVAQGGVGHLVSGMLHPDADVTACCSAMLARVAKDACAQQAIRDAGGLPLAVELLSRSASASEQLQLLALITSLAAGSEDGSAVATVALLEFVAADPLPRTQAKESALGALHSLASSSSLHLDGLRSVPGAAQQLADISAAYDASAGGRWYSARPALAGLRGLLAAAEAAAAAPIAGDAPELVELP